MTNREFYKERILEIAYSGNRVAISKNGELCACDSLFACKNCALLGDAMGCKNNFQKWLNEEHVEPCPFEKDELVEVSDDKHNWTLRHFAGMVDDAEYSFAVYIRGNTSKEVGCDTAVYRYCRKYGTLGGLTQESRDE